MYRIRRFGIVKTATTVAVLYMVTVAIFVVPFLLLVAVAGTSLTNNTTGNLPLNLGSSVAVGFGAIFLYGLIGWVFTAIACAIYNLVAGWVGGVEIQLEAVAAPPPVPAWGPSTNPPAPPPPPVAG